MNVYEYNNVNTIAVLYNSCIKFVWILFLKLHVVVIIIIVSVTFQYNRLYINQTRVVFRILFLYVFWIHFKIIQNNFLKLDHILNSAYTAYFVLFLFSTIIE